MRIARYILVGCVGHPAAGFSLCRWNAWEGPLWFHQYPRRTCTMRKVRIDLLVKATIYPEKSNPNVCLHADMVGEPYCPPPLPFPMSWAAVSFFPLAIRYPHEYFHQSCLPWLGHWKDSAVSFDRMRIGLLSTRSWPIVEKDSIVHSITLLCGPSWLIQTPTPSRKGKISNKSVKPDCCRYPWRSLLKVNYGYRTTNFHVLAYLSPYF